MKNILKILLLVSLLVVLSCSKKEEKDVLYVGTNAEYPPFEYLDENGDEKTISKDTVRQAVGADLAVGDIIAENKEDLQEMQKQSEKVQDAAEELGQKYGIETLGDTAQQFLVE